MAASPDWSCFVYFEHDHKFSFSNCNVHSEVVRCNLGSVRVFNVDNKRAKSLCNRGVKIKGGIFWGGRVVDFLSVILTCKGREQRTLLVIKLLFRSWDE